MTTDEQHIFYWAAPRQRQHELAADCWCDPELVEPCRVGGLVIVAHTGQPQPSVKHGPVSLFPGNLGRGVLRGHTPGAA